MTSSQAVQKIPGSGILGQVCDNESMSTVVCLRHREGPHGLHSSSHIALLDQPRKSSLTGLARWCSLRWHRLKVQQ